MLKDNWNLPEKLDLSETHRSPSSKTDDNYVRVVHTPNSVISLSKQVGSAMPQLRSYHVNQASSTLLALARYSGNTELMDVSKSRCRSHSFLVKPMNMAFKLKAETEMGTPTVTPFNRVNTFNQDMGDGPAKAVESVTANSTQGQSEGFLSEDCQETKATSTRMEPQSEDSISGFSKRHSEITGKGNNSSSSEQLHEVADNGDHPPVPNAKQRSGQAAASRFNDDRYERIFFGLEKRYSMDYWKSDAVDELKGMFDGKRVEKATSIYQVIDAYGAAGITELELEVGK